MTDEQLHRRMISKRFIIVAIVLFMLSGGLLYYRHYSQPEIDAWESEKRQESVLQSQITQLQNSIDQLSATINETGKELISFSDDKIVYINLASELSLKYGVTINEISVSDIWTEGQMAGMTTIVEVEGTFEGVRGFVSEYCGTSHTNRITKIACRPDARYEWMYRYIDDLQILKWFDLSLEEQMYEIEKREQERLEQQEILNNGGSVEGSIVTVKEEEIKSISIDEMFSDFTFKLYLQVDFLGRH